MASVIINYSSMEEPFIRPLLKECLKFSDDIVISYGSHLYNGEPEDISIIHQYQKEFPTVKFVGYSVDFSVDPYLQPGIFERPSIYWFNFARYNAIQHLQNKEWVFVIDADEIPEGEYIKEWLQHAKLDIMQCYKMSCYWYFKTVTNQCTALQDSPLLIHGSHLREDTIFGDWDRDDIVRKSNTISNRNVIGLNNLVLFHHYSWVRSKANLFRKLQTSADVNSPNSILKNKRPEEVLQIIFKDENINDIVFNQTYIKVLNYFNIHI